VRVALYARVSTSDRDQDPDTQLYRLRDYVAARDSWVIAGQYVDRASASDLGHRTEWRRLLDGAARRRFDAVLVFKLDRAFRSVKHMHDTLSAWEIVSAQEGFDSDRGRIDAAQVVGVGPPKEGNWTVYTAYTLPGALRRGVCSKARPTFGTSSACSGTRIGTTMYMEMDDAAQHERGGDTAEGRRYGRGRGARHGVATASVAHIKYADCDVPAASAPLAKRRSGRPGTLKDLNGGACPLRQ